MTIKIQPSSKNIICLQAEPEKTKSGLILQDDEKTRPEIAIVYAIGRGKVPISLKKGDKIIYRKYMDTKLTVGGSEFICIEFKDIIAKIL